MIFHRRTLRNSTTLEGLGLHTGIPVRVAIHPGENGIAFRLGTHRVAAHPANVTDTTRSTRLGEIGTVEHLMSALAGLEITDAEIEVDAPEMPGLDGSSIAYVKAILEAGTAEIGEREVPPLFTRVFLQEDDGTKVAIAKGGGHWRYIFTTGERWPGEQAYEREDAVAGYAEEIAPARTFAFAEEIPFIIQMGLGKGLDETSALILGIEGYKNDSRFADEPARHKLLDLMGDLYLAGVPVRALSVVAERSGHRANVHAASLLAEAVGH
jgi:UDP-3-O-acyl-N-acetylglucosamine deacetylase